LRPSLPIAHWCHDVFPEAIVAHGLTRETSPLYRMARRLVKAGYQQCDLIADLGPCMRRCLEAYDVPARRITVTPWALSEPGAALEPDPEMRENLFGDARLGLLYTGNFGQAHTADLFLELARALRGEPIRFCFAVRGTREHLLRQQTLPEDTNIGFAPFAEEDDLPRHLSAGDIHLASLGPDWTGLAVPSKFFGSLAAGRPVLYAGPEDSSVAGWIRQHHLGWVLNRETLGSIAERLRQLARDPSGLGPLQARCHDVYREQFSRDRMVDQWDTELRALVPLRSLRPRRKAYPAPKASEPARELEGASARSA
jgi:glycosyltransferase involved in cell wall biosynthesis